MYIIKQLFAISFSFVLVMWVLNTPNKKEDDPLLQFQYQDKLLLQFQNQEQNKCVYYTELIMVI